MIKAKRIATLFLGLTMLCCFFVIGVGCYADDANKEMQQQISELEKQINSQKDKIIALENEISNQKNKIDELEKENANSAHKIDELEFQISKGKFYTLQEAYARGLLSQEDLQSIALHHNNGENYHEALADSVAILIKKSAAFNARNDIKSPVLDAKAEDFIILNYYGNYNGCYAIILNHPYSGEPAVERDEIVTIGGVDIRYLSWNEIVVWESNFAN